MKVCGNSFCRWLCLVAVSGVTSHVVDAQSRDLQRGTSSKVSGADAADILQQLGAKLEGAASSKTLDDYSNQFDRSDANRDGKHTREEYVENGRYLTPQARSGIFRAADGDTDGVVTRSEYVLNRIITDEAKAIVQGMDDDRDGLVSRTEFIKHATSLFSDRELVELVFPALDTNADGEIHIPEYLRVWGRWARAGSKSAEERIAARRAELSKTQGHKPIPVGEADVSDELAGMLAKHLESISRSVDQRQ